jgi:hypothetical protein
MVVGAVLGLATSLVALSTTSAAAQTPGAAGQLAVVRDTAGGPGLYLMGADGSHARLIWRGNQLVNPSWTADGTRLAAAMVPPGSASPYRQLFVQDMVTGTRTQLTQDENEDKTSPAWSPDGTRIAYSGFGVTDNLYVMSADGSNRRTLASGCAVDPNWSPDGATIAYFSCTTLEIYTVPTAPNADGSTPAPTQLTHDDLIWDKQPDFSPDGRSIVYVHGVAGGAEQLWIMDADGGNQRALHPDGVGDFDPTFSPDGASVVFVAPDLTEPGTPNRLYTVDVAGGTTTRLDDGARAGENDFYIGWQPRPTVPDAQQAPWIAVPGVTAPAMPYGSNLASYACVDAVDPAPACTATLDGTPLATGATLSGTAVGTHTLVVTARDATGNTTTRTVTYKVLALGAVETTVSPGQTVTTAPATTGAMPVVAAITVPAGVPAGSALSVTPQTPGTSPPGYSILGQQMVIEGPAATAAAPYTLTLMINEAALAGTAVADVQILRNGVPVADCTDPVAAVPDPCVAERQPLSPDGAGPPRPPAPGGSTSTAATGARVTVRTAHFSTWSLAKKTVSYALRGPFAPIDAGPVVNTARAGTTIPVRFALGGNRGLDVLAGIPTVTAATCGTRRDEVELQLPRLPTSQLVYEPRTQQYVYLWSTDTSMRGCRALTLTFRDGSTLRTLYQLR